MSALRPPPTPPQPLSPSHLAPFLAPFLPSPSPSTPPLLLSLTGPQGSGKSTLAASLASYLQTQHSLRTLILSLDDFYLPHPQLLALAAANPTNPLLQHRGNPGTHDTALLLSVLRGLKNNEPVKVPRYDKALHFGAGDRAGWEDVAPGARVVILEGWCVGFRSVGLQAGEGEEGMTWVDAQLAHYGAVWREVDVAVVVSADLGFVEGWRWEQEEWLRREGRGGMTRDEVARFVEGYMPAYRLYAGTVGEGWLQRGRVLRVKIGREREVMGWEVL